jgi:hypothetical protein
MKNILLLIVCLFSLNAFSSTTEVEIISAEYGVEDYDFRRILCLTVVKIPKSGALLGIVESIEDCFYARLAKNAPDNRLRLPLKKLMKIPHPEMQQHLQRIDTQLKFYFLTENKN